MPHFYAIGMYRYKDYRAANLPILPVKRGMAAARFQIIIYILLFTVAAALLSVFGYTGYIYLVAVILFGLYWLYQSRSKLKDEAWGKRMFLASLVVTLGTSFLIAVGGRLP